MQKKNFGVGKAGNCLCFWFQKKIVLNIGPDWPFNLCMLTLIIGAFCGFLFYMAPRVNPGMQYLGCSVISLLFVSYCTTALKNPGIQLDSAEVDLEHGKPSLCQTCRIYKHKDTEHCDDCDLCIIELDHHCPFTGKCIGKDNLAFFYTFLFSIFATFAYFFVWLIALKARLNK